MICSFFEGRWEETRERVQRQGYPSEGLWLIGFRVKGFGLTVDQIFVCQFYNEWFMVYSLGFRIRVAGLKLRVEG